MIELLAAAIDLGMLVALYIIAMLLLAISASGLLWAILAWAGSTDE